MGWIICHKKIVIDPSGIYFEVWNEIVKAMIMLGPNSYALKTSYEPFGLALQEKAKHQWMEGGMGMGT